ncbi:protein STRUBBELIG-RECEPTOR FAMILY 6-like isoform X2 [Momordica charantia]|uniref:Protein STRUBBELIG-RECEPTOR FAMILY 6-like isoform X2 n=1 Tax=Momordica charantia TaxID=3673 RepID=A0A6J1DI92_MOMCH|nr:protein STRUBBELIG-RECEPTOR FAMILY 6-like isoform X2 [Momordica charantia]
MVKNWSWGEPLLLINICIFGWMASFISGDTDPGDVSALNSMYSSLNLPPILIQWSSSGGDPCGLTWKGITCSGSRVTEISLSGLGLSGSLGYQLSSLTALINLDVSINNLGPDIPYQLPQNLQKLNLGSNNYSGSLPYSISQMSSLISLNISHNQLRNQVNDMFWNLSSLSTLDFSFNSLSGALPQSFSNLTSMNSMFLQNNQLSGTIDVLANLPLQNLNVENNNFTGWIPERLKNINIQEGANSWSFGLAPPPPPGTPVNQNYRYHKPGINYSPLSSDAGGGGSSRSGISGGAIAGILISVIVVGAVLAYLLVKRRPKRSSTDIEKQKQKLGNLPSVSPASNEVQDSLAEMKLIHTSSSFDAKALDSPASINLKPPPIERHKSFDDNDTLKISVVKNTNAAPPISVRSYSIADLQMATGSFNVENLLGEGSFGRVYRAQFDDGKVLAVKKIDSSALPRELLEDFTEIVANVSQLHHPNVTELMGYCSEHGLHLLLYEFHKNGSLHDFLHIADDYSKPLTWNSRVKIALGTARALEYLHEVCAPSVVHRNIKSANILLDAELNPHLSDCGLASFITNLDQALDQQAGSGYSAPEVTMSGQYTLKSDVYSFGVVMLELLSGRKPFDSSRPRTEQSLVRWATPQLHDIDALTKMVDPALKGLYPVKSLSRFADVVALCVQPEPEFRPPMSEVVEALVRLVQRSNMSRRTFGSDHTASFRTDDPDVQDTS